MFKFSLDWWIVVPSLMLCAFSAAILRGSAPQVFTSQLIYIGISSLIFLLMSKIDYKTLFLFHRWFYILSVAFLLLPLIFGAISRGATRWLQIGDITLQPSELVKPFLLISFVHLAQSRERWSFFWLTASILLPVILIFLQPDLGTVLVICVGWLICAITRFSTKQIILWSVLGLLCLVPIYEFVLHDYQRERITTFVDPYADPLGKGYHVIQSLIAVGSGQIAGRGLGHGPQSQLQFLPEHTTDFIFASLSESFGFIGSTTVLVIYLVLLRHIYDISKNSPDPLASLYCVAIIATFGFQIWVNVGMNIGIAPVTGITLPLMSRGGSSLISTAISLALVNHISSGSKKFQ